MTKSSERAFTLIELLVAAAILLLACSSSFVMLRGVSRESLNSSILTKSIYIVQAKLEEIRSISFEDLGPLGGQAFSGGKGKIDIKPVLPDLMEIKITFDWNKKRKPIEIYTLRSKHE